MIMKNSFRILTAILIFLSVNFNLSAQNQVSVYQMLFTKGNIAQKIQAVDFAGKDNNYVFLSDCLDFCIQSNSLIGPDADIDNLTINVLKNFNNTASLMELNDVKLVCKKIQSCFNNFSSDHVKIACLNRFAVFNNPENVKFVNDYVSDKALNNQPMTSVILSAVNLMGKIGNNESFSILFAADIANVWPKYSSYIQSAYSTLAVNASADLINLFTKAPVEQKLMVLNLIKNSSEIPEFVKGQLAQKSLSLSIINIDEEQDISPAQNKLMSESVNLLAQTNWSMSSEVVVDYFPLAQNLYQKEQISAEDFISIIQSCTQIASQNMVLPLIKYLNFLNRSTQENKPVNTQVVLSVINSLGGLGDKQAFDELLFVTYLDYTQEVLEAAKSALDNLKW